MDRRLLITLGIVLLIFEAMGEAIMYARTNPNDWLLVLIAFVNYATAWFVLTITDERRMDIVEYSDDEDIELNSGGVNSGNEVGDNINASLV